MLTGWLRTPAPPLPNVEAAGKQGCGRRHNVPLAGAGAGPCEPGGEQAPQGDAGSAGPAGGSSSGGSGLKGPVPAGALVAPLGIAAALSSARHWGFLWKGLALHSASLAAQLAARPLQPLYDRLQRQLAATDAVRAACAQLRVGGLQELQDLMNCVLLAEHVYKIVDHDTDTSVAFINAVKAEFPPHLVTLRAVQWAQPHVRHRFLLGESPDALYVSFMGTKLPRDMATNANLFQEEVVLDAAMLSAGGGAVAGEDGAAAAAAGGRPQPAAHRGFLERARSVPIHALYREARARGKRLVLCGHSLGGAVASLCAVQLLQHLPPNLHHTVSCYGFATPALGNDALAATVAEAGWDARIHNYLSPDDPIPGLLSFRRPPGAAAAEQAAAATAAKRAAAEGAAAAAQAAPPAGGEATAGNVVPVPQLAAAAAEQQRLRRATSHVAAGGQATSSSQDAEPQPQPQPQPKPQPQQQAVAATAAPSAAASQPRGSSAPEAPADAAAKPDEGNRLARAGVAAAAGAAVAAAVLGQDVDVAAATTAAVAAAMMRQEGAPAQVQAAGARGAGHSEDESAGEPARPRDAPRWLGRRLAAVAAPPLRAAAQAAGSAALAAAAPPVRAVVQRAGSAARMVALPLSAAASVPMRAAPQYQPLGRQLYITPAAVTAAKPPGDVWEGRRGAPAPPAPRRWPSWRGGAAAAGGGSSLDDEDNVDVAAAAALGDPAGPAAAGGGERRPRRGVFDSHRMATYRARLLAICQESLEGQLLLRSLPMLPSLPRPGDVAASELLAPPMFPLKAVASLAAQPAEAAAGGEAAVGGEAGAGGEAGRAPRRGGFWGRLLARAALQQRAEPPLELLIRVEGRGLANVRRAWVEGVPAAPAEGGPEPAGAGARHGAEVTILQQPAPLLLPPLERPPLPVFGQLSAFASWLAVTLGWVALLRQLQPAGNADYLLARVRLPAAAVRDARAAAQSSLLSSVADGPLLHGLHLGPRLSLRLQSDFATHQLPLDIRVAAGPAPALAWRWPWARAARPAAAAPALPRAALKTRRRRSGRWWEWPRGAAAAEPATRAAARR